MAVQNFAAHATVTKDSAVEPNVESPNAAPAQASTEMEVAAKTAATLDSGARQAPHSPDRVSTTAPPEVEFDWIAYARAARASQASATLRASRRRVVGYALVGVGVALPCLLISPPSIANLRMPDASRPPVINKLPPTRSLAVTSGRPLQEFIDAIAVVTVRAIGHELGTLMPAQTVNAAVAPSDTSPLRITTALARQALRGQRPEQPVREASQRAKVTAAAVVSKAVNQQARAGANMPPHILSADTAELATIQPATTQPATAQVAAVPVAAAPAVRSQVVTPSPDITLLNASSPRAVPERAAAPVSLAAATPKPQQPDASAPLHLEKPLPRYASLASSGTGTGAGDVPASNSVQPVAAVSVAATTRERPILNSRAVNPDTQVAAAAEPENEIRSSARRDVRSLDAEADELQQEQAPAPIPVARTHRANKAQARRSSDRQETKQASKRWSRTAALGGPSTTGAPAAASFLGLRIPAMKPEWADEVFARNRR